jgi:hypothetical protein
MGLFVARWPDATDFVVRRRVANAAREPGKVADLVSLG